MNNDNQSLRKTLESSAVGSLANWRIFVLWIAMTLIPVGIVSLPVGRLLSEHLDHSVHADEWANGLDVAMFGELIANSTDAVPMLTGAVVISVLVVVLVWPFLTAMVVASAREPRALGFVALIRGGARDYGRLLRMLLWSIVPLGVAGGIGGFALHVSHKRGLKVILESQATRDRWMAMTLLIVLLVLAHVTVEAGRAQFALDASRRSAVKAWWRGVRLVIDRPVPALGSYLVLTLVGLVAIAALGILRIDAPHVTFFGLLVAFILTQLIAATAIWMRLARLLALVHLGRARNLGIQADHS